jgi:phospholipid/cholesterol/gamma-HCH transport system ATP-binding protein
MIKVNNLSKKFGDKTILNNVGFEVGQELIAILGSTGVGKSVFLKIIAGLVKPSSGQVIIDKGETTGFIFQHSALFDFLSVEQNIKLPLEEGTSFTEKEIDVKVKEITALLGIRDSMLKQNCNDLSGGERKIIAIARAIIKQPTYLLYDEPTTGLDAITHDKICNIIRSLNKPGILVTHNKYTIRTIGINTIYLLAAGRLSLIRSAALTLEKSESDQF